jgi:hypothetical protein
MSLYQQAMLQALGIQQYAERHTLSDHDLASTSEVETPVPAPQELAPQELATQELPTQELAPQELPPQKTYPQVPDRLIRDIQIALGVDVSVNFGTEITVAKDLVTLPYPFSTSDKPMLLKALHGHA